MENFIFCAMRWQTSLNNLLKMFKVNSILNNLKITHKVIGQITVHNNFVLKLTILFLIFYVKTLVWI